MSFPRYPEYKDSGVEWLGEVPGHWEVFRLGALFREAADEGEEDLHHRLKELGLVAWTKVFVKRFAPLGDPMEILVRGYSLSLRKQDASKVIVKRIVA